LKPHLTGNVQKTEKVAHTQQQQESAALLGGAAGSQEEAASHIILDTVFFLSFLT
jgi:hypothetical protein